MVRRKRLFQPANSARILVGHRRSPASDYLLATILAFVAGAANAGGFFALGQYTSHMTGYLSQIPTIWSAAIWPLRGSLRWPSAPLSPGPGSAAC